MSSSLMLGLGLAGIFTGLASAVAVAINLRGEQRQLQTSLAAVSGGPAGTPTPRSLRDRVLLPGLAQFTGLGRKLSPAGAVDRLRRQLDLAGNPAAWPLERVLAAKGAGLIGFAVLGLWLFADRGFVGILFIVGMTALGLFLPDLLVYNAGHKRQEKIQKDLPDAMDLMTISVEAGLGFDGALAQVARNTDGPLSGEVFRVLQEMQIGRSRVEAFRSLTERSNVTDLSAFVGAMVQADSLGIPIAAVLRTQTKEMRLKRRQRAEEKAMKVPVKILMPMMVFILPVLFVIILAPGAMSIMSTLAGG